ncbi:MAG: hypothetical protein JEZ11_23760 [Desulfobacterales bacterium]|nr:hypothetical protein [Desulfobacterales bacterium]
MSDNLRLRLLLSVLLVLGLVLLISERPKHPSTPTSPPKPRNQLALGNLSNVSGPIVIPINPAVEFDFKSKSEILRLRSEAVFLHPEFLYGKYIPSERVFGGIEDSRPWWGLKGYHFFWKGKNSISGASEESRFVMNPFLLVAAHLFGDSLYTLVYDRWEQSLSSNAIPAKNEIPSYSQAAKLTWWPKKRKIELLYDLTAFFHQMYGGNMESADFSDMRFDLVAYNARDMNLEYLYISLSTGANVGQKDHSANPVKIMHFLHRGGSCGYPGGCNNMSPNQPPVQDIRIFKLPASIEVFLWEKQPDSLEVPPDIVVEIKFI